LKSSVLAPWDKKPPSKEDDPLRFSVSEGFFTKWSAIPCGKKFPAGIKEKRKEKGAHEEESYV
jgi:hypothetical protein